MQRKSNSITLGLQTEEDNRLTKQELEVYLTTAYEEIPLEDKRDSANSCGSIGELLKTATLIFGSPKEESFITPSTTVETAQEAITVDNTPPMESYISEKRKVEEQRILEEEVKVSLARDESGQIFEVKKLSEVYNTSKGEGNEHEYYESALHPNFDCLKLSGSTNSSVDSDFTDSD